MFGLVPASSVAAHSELAPSIISAPSIIIATTLRRACRAAAVRGAAAGAMRAACARGAPATCCMRAMHMHDAVQLYRCGTGTTDPGGRAARR